MALEDAEQDIRPPLIFTRQPGVMLVRQAEGHGASFLQRRGRADGKEIVHLANRAGE